MSIAPAKYLRVAQDVESRIAAQQWRKNDFPSVRTLAREYSVSVVTAVRALQVLRDKGIIAAVERSGCYLVDRVAGERWALALRVTPGPWREATLKVNREGFAKLADETKVGVSDVLQWGDDADPDAVRQLAARAKADGVTGAVMLPSRLDEASARQDAACLEGCAKAGIPVVLVQRNLRGHDRLTEWDLVSSDEVDGGRLCTQHLLDQGCRRLAFVTASPTSTHRDRLTGFLHAIFVARQADSSLAEPVVLTLPNPDKHTWAATAEQLLAKKVDGVVCYQDYAAMCLILECLRRGARVPQDLAVIGFDNLPLVNAFSIGVSTFSHASDEIARRAIQLLRDRRLDPRRPPVQVVVPGQLIARESSQREAVAS